MNKSNVTCCVLVGMCVCINTHICSAGVFVFVKSMWFLM